MDSSTQITAGIYITSSADPGGRDVSVTTPFGTIALTDGFTVTHAPPTVTSVSPDEGAPGQTLSVTISGTYLTGATAVSFGDRITTDAPYL